MTDRTPLTNHQKDELRRAKGAFLLTQGRDPMEGSVEDARWLNGYMHGYKHAHEPLQGALFPAAPLTEKCPKCGLQMSNWPGQMTKCIKCLHEWYMNTSRT